MLTLQVGLSAMMVCGLIFPLLIMLCFIRYLDLKVVRGPPRTGVALRSHRFQTSSHCVLQATDRVQARTRLGVASHVASGVLRELGSIVTALWNFHSLAIGDQCQSRHRHCTFPCP